MSTYRVFARVVMYALILSAVDAASGRFLQASPDLNVVLSLGATGWIAYRLAESGQARIAFPAGIVMWVVYLAGYALWAWLLVGWNRSVPWHPRSTTWLAVFAMAAPVVALVGQSWGTGARASKLAEAEPKA